ncbi:MAG: multicopper oxidase domain-containing protein [Gammaproteobacteria bacterium]|nr:multicopper oxidase domain-containing protein [Gammaproteobacteria bacterium]
MRDILREPLMMGMGAGGGGGGIPAGGSRSFGYLASPATVGVNMNGSLTMADGISIRTWSFNNGGGFNGDRTVPSPVIEANEGETVQITLNVPMMSPPHTIHPHGLDVDQQNDGVGATSFEVQGGGSYTYTFTAPHAGTYMYHCHVDTVLHFEMGMYGTIIIRPPNGSATLAWDGGPSFDKEYIWQLHTFDSSWHNSGNTSGPNTTRHSPDYFMINGSDGANLNTDTTVAVSATAGQKVLIRTNGVGYQPAMIRLGGLVFDVIASDGRPLPAPISATEWLVAPGERYDLLLTMPSSGQYTATVDYFNIRRQGILGTATTLITVV